MYRILLVLLISITGCSNNSNTGTPQNLWVDEPRHQPRGLPNDSLNVKIIDNAKRWYTFELELDGKKYKFLGHTIYTTHGAVNVVFTKLD